MTTHAALWYTRLLCRSSMWKRITVTIMWCAALTDSSNLTRENMSRHVCHVLTPATSTSFSSLRSCRRSSLHRHCVLVWTSGITTSTIPRTQQCMTRACRRTEAIRWEFTTLTSAATSSMTSTRTLLSTTRAMRTNSRSIWHMTGTSLLSSMFTMAHASNGSRSMVRTLPWRMLPANM